MLGFTNKDNYFIPYWIKINFNRYKLLKDTGYIVRGVKRTVLCGGDSILSKASIKQFKPRLLICIISGFILTSCSFNETWIGFYYPDENNLLTHKQSNELKSLKECQDWVDTQIQIYNPSGYGYDYECGKNCKMSDNFGLYTCKETVQ